MKGEGFLETVAVKEMSRVVARVTRESDKVSFPNCLLAPLWL